MNSFERIQLNGWRQFGNLEIDLTSRVTVITGANGTGKTSLLNVLSRHFGWNFSFVTAPFLSKRTRRRIYTDILNDFYYESNSRLGAKPVGSISYSNGAVCDLKVPATGDDGVPQYQIQYDNPQIVPGLHVPSHRSPSSYQAVGSIPTSPKTHQQFYQEFQQVLLSSISGAKSQNPGLILKQSLISLAVFGYGNEAVQENDHYRELFEGFQRILRALLPPELGFKRLEVRVPDVVLVTETGDFSLDAMSGGISSIFGLAWQIHMSGIDQGGCTVLVDEPENHLHPQMQRSLLPRLREAFPNYRFIVATHSPFIITSDEKAAVYGLRYAGDRRVYAERLSRADLSASPERVLQDVLDVPLSLPIWVEERIRAVLSNHPNPTKESAGLILEELRRAGLERALAGYQARPEAR